LAVAVRQPQIDGTDWTFTQGFFECGQHYSL
jgi:hypothetical protein